MQAVILAAGEGRRLRPLTEHLPKPMVRLNGLPILQHTLSILPSVIDEVILVVGYKKEKIIDYFGSSFNGLPLKYVEQDRPLGTADALDRARPYLREGYFLHLFGDDLYHPEDLKMCAEGQEPTVLVKESPHPDRFGVCIVDDQGYLKNVLEKKPNPPSNLVNIGVYLLNRDIFDVPKVKLPGGEYNLSEQISSWASKAKIKVLEARFWQPVGYLEDLPIAEQLLQTLAGTRTD